MLHLLRSASDAEAWGIVRAAGPARVVVIEGEREGDAGAGVEVVPCGAPGGGPDALDYEALVEEVLRAERIYVW